MVEKILFSLENCMKCTQTKELLTNRSDIKLITFPHDINDWTDEQLNDAKSHDIFEDLQKTAPILWLDGEKKIGYLNKTDKEKPYNYTWDQKTIDIYEIKIITHDETNRTATESIKTLLINFGLDINMPSIIRKITFKINN